MRALLVLGLLVLAIAAAGCRAPGEPPSHPDRGAYRDLMRREVGAAESALASGELTLRYLDERRLPRAYARVMLRQAANDLRKVGQDLGEVTPPAAVARAHARMATLTRRDQQLLERLDSSNRADRQTVRTALARDAGTLGDDLDPVLVSG
jgi:hypothetical protein